MVEDKFRRLGVALPNSGKSVARPVQQLVAMATACSHPEIDGP